MTSGSSKFKYTIVSDHLQESKGGYNEVPLGQVLLRVQLSVETDCNCKEIVHNCVYDADLKKLLLLRQLKQQGYHPKDRVYCGRLQGTREWELVFGSCWVAKGIRMNH